MLTDRGDIAVVWGVAVVMKMVGKRWGQVFGYTVLRQEALRRSDGEERSRD